MNRITFTQGFVVVATAVFTAAAGISIGCNAVLDNEEGIPRLDAGPQIGVQAHPLVDGGAVAECNTDAGQKVCFGLCVSADDPKTGCSGASCVACDPKNVKGAQCNGSADGFACAFDECKSGFDNCDSDKTNGCETSLGTAAACGSCQKKCKSDLPFCTVVDGGAFDCVATCPEGTTACAGAGSCVDITTSVDNCGACGTKCERTSATATCVNKQCVFTCVSGFHQCGDACVFANDTNHCGDSCTACSPNPAGHQDATCLSGTCGLTCSTGWADCDSDLSNGCEYFGSTCPVPTTTSSSSTTTSGGTTSGTVCGCTSGGVYELGIKPLIVNCTLACAVSTE